MSNRYRGRGAVTPAEQLLCKFETKKRDSGESRRVGSGMGVLLESSLAKKTAVL